MLVGMNTPRPLTTAEAAAALGKSRETARRQAANGQLDATKVGRDWLIEPESVTRGLAGRTLTDLAKCEKRISELETLIAGDGGGNLGARRMLTWEREYRGRLLNLLRSYGATP
jgi:excisionase family DNA binding protein